MIRAALCLLVFQAGCVGVELWQFEVTHDADTLTFTVPADAQTGTLMLEVESTSPVALNEHHVLTHAITIVE